MNAGTGRLHGDARRRVDAHLDEIEQVLQRSGMSRDERRNVLDDVETQVLEMLAARVQGDPSPEDVSAVIAELDPPESYAVGAGEPEGAAAPPTRISRLAVLGAFWGSLFVIAIVLAPIVALRVPVGAHPHRSLAWWQILWLILMVTAVTGMFGMTILGAVAVSQIRDSRRRLHGLGLAFADAVFYPLLALGAVLLVLATELKRFCFPVGHDTTVVVATVAIYFVALVAWAVLGWLFGRWAWGVATRRSAA